MTQFVYSFNEGSGDMRNLLGGKGANLAEMTKIGLPVPFGFTVTTEACREYHDTGSLSEDVLIQLNSKMSEVEHVMGKNFGSTDNPLLVSVRSGTASNHPFMSETILNLGLNDEIAQAIVDSTGNETFVYEIYKRFIITFGNVVFGVPEDVFKSISDTNDAETVRKYKDYIFSTKGVRFPKLPERQLQMAVEAIFHNSYEENTVKYRRLNKEAEEAGVAVNVQAMVFGNIDDFSGTGVGFSRNPFDGRNDLFGEFIQKAQGNTIVEGMSIPYSIDKMRRIFPDAYKQLWTIASVLEKHYKSVQEVEFTVQKGKLYVLQAQNAYQTAKSSVKTAVDMVSEKLITKEVAVMKIKPLMIEQLLKPVFRDNPETRERILVRGLFASPGYAVGKACFSADAANKYINRGENVILIRKTVSFDNIEELKRIKGLITIEGGGTSHMAALARSLKKSYIAGCAGITLNDNGTAFFGDREIKEGDYISIDGFCGIVYSGKIEMVRPEFTSDYNTILSWADGIRTLKVRTNADMPGEVRRAVDLGAEGIGLCRTEHMFDRKDRKPLLRKMILSDSETERKDALLRVFDCQKADFLKIFRIVEDKPITIRLFDPQIEEKKGNEKIDCIPIMGSRGCRIAVNYPEIARMQSRAIIEAAIEVTAENDFDVSPEIMIPVIGISKEFAYIRQIIDDVALEAMKKADLKIDYQVGSMIEIPRAALTADKIACEADFFSFGTNDLTQFVFGMLKADTESLVEKYIETGIIDDNPFETIDQNGVGKLMMTAVKLGRMEKPNLKVGICGIHAGEPKSIDFCHRIGLNYLSCPPLRIPIARIAAAQAAIRNRK